MTTKKPVNKWQFGDFQTSEGLARKVVEVLKRNHGIEPDVVIEPTCGKGSFLLAAYEGFKNADLRGYEINSAYVSEACSSLEAIHAADRVDVREADFFIQIGKKYFLA